MDPASEIMNGSGAADQRGRPGHYELRLYISGMTARSGAAISTVRAVCDRHVGGRYTLEVVDIYERPELACEANIRVAPTLVRVQPGPERRLVGDLGDEADMVRRLGLAPAAGPSQTPDEERAQ